MDNKITSFDQLNGLFAKVRELGKRPLTNFYWDDNKHPYWLISGEFLFQEFPGCVLLIKDNGVFLNLFYFTADIDALRKSLQVIELKKQVSLDIVSREEAPIETLIFKDYGFENYRDLYRMSHIGQLPYNPILSDNIYVANKYDLEKVRKMLLDNFDPLSEQIPSLFELGEINKTDGVIVYKENDDVFGFSIFEDKGLTWYWRYWYVSELYRGKGIGSRLYNVSVKTSLLSKRQILWVVSDNDNAIKRHLHYGFKKENLYDYVLLKNK